MEPVYNPSHFAVTDPEAIRQVIREHAFATLVTSGEDEPIATHIPLVLDGARLVGHMARANQHWKLFDGRTSLAIFQGPHAYVSSRHYITSPNLPTWNYVTVHVYGKPKVFEAREETEKVLRKTLSYLDPDLRLTSANEDFLQKLLPGIAAFQISIERMEGKFKLSQNRLVEDREAVIERFSNSTHPLERAVAESMKKLYAGQRYE